MKKLLVDTRTACDMLSIKKTLLFQLLRDGTLIRRKCGSKTLITLASVERVAKRRAS